MVKLSLTRRVCYLLLAGCSLCLATGASAADQRVVLTALVDGQWVLYHSTDFVDWQALDIGGGGPAPDGWVGRQDPTLRGWGRPTLARHVAAAPA